MSNEIEIIISQIIESIINDAVTNYIKITTVDTNNFRDVHTEYDSKYTHDICTKYTIQEKKDKFNILINEMQSLHLDLRGIQTVINDSQTPSNFDTINNLYADDVLIEIINVLEILSALDENNFNRISIYKNIIEQMNDMITLGSCPQGRTNRLMQIYKSLLE